MGKGILILIVFLVLAGFSYSAYLSDRYEAKSSDDLFELSVSYKSNAGYYNNSDWETHFIWNQPAIGLGNDSFFNAYLGYIYMLNFRPTFNNTKPSAVRLDSVRVKHPYTNNTLVCEINFTEYDLGDIVTVYVTWYRNSTGWYNNSEIIGDYNVSDYVAKYNVAFENWDEDNETFNTTNPNSTFFSVNTSTIGNIEPDDTDHYDIWMCSARLYDQMKYSWSWMNSSPVMIFNKPPIYNDTMPTYYEWPEDTSYSIDLGSNFTDIDGDDINWYINWTSTTVGYNYLHPDNFTITIDNDTGIVDFVPLANVTGYMYIKFTAVDNNASITDDWYLRNDYGHTNTSLFLINVTQVNDPPNATNVYIDPAEPTYKDNLTCEYSFWDIENNEENTSVTSYEWWINDEGVSTWQLIPNSNTSVLTPDHFDLDDAIICSVRVKDIYYGYDGSDESLWALNYVNSSYVVITVEEETPNQEDNIIIAVG